MSIYPEAFHIYQPPIYIFAPIYIDILLQCSVSIIDNHLAFILKNNFHTGQAYSAHLQFTLVTPVLRQSCSNHFQDLEKKGGKSRPLSNVPLFYSPSFLQFKVQPSPQSLNIILAFIGNQLRAVRTGVTFPPGDYYYH